MKKTIKRILRVLLVLTLAAVIGYFTTMYLQLENGRMDGIPKERKYYRQSKKICASRYATDCLSGIFDERAAVNTVGIDDLREYADRVARNDELKYQNSHFQNEINELKNKTV